MIYNLLLSFIGGLLVSCSPCTLPILPILIARIAQDTKYLSLLLYILGLSLTYVILGVIVTTCGIFWTDLFQHSTTFIVLSLFMVYMAAVSFNLLTMPMMSANIKYSGAFIEGVVSAIIMSPCVTPVLAAILVSISETNNIILGGLSLFFLAIGMCTPLVLLAVFGVNLLKLGIGKYMKYIGKVVGIVLLGMAINFGYQAYAVADTSIHTQQELTQAVKQHKNVIVLVTAAWCHNCATQKRILQSEEVRAKLSSYEVVILDVTTQGPASNLSHQMHIVGVPTLIIYKDGKEVTRDVGVATAKQLLNIL